MKKKQKLIDLSIHSEKWGYINITVVRAINGKTQKVFWTAENYFRRTGITTFFGFYN